MNQLIHEDLSWCLQRLPESWRTLMQNRPNQLFLAGGFIRSVIANEKINDADFFCPNADIAAACALSLDERGKLRVIRTDNAYTVCTHPVTAQFIHRWTFAKPEDAIASFDFTIAKAAVWWGTRAEENSPYEWQSCVDERFYPDMAGKRLVYVSPIRNEDAGGSLLRVLKFYQRGYRIPLDSMGAVIARLVKAVDFDAIQEGAAAHKRTEEQQLARVLSGLLRQVDPNIDPTHEAHLPATTKE